MNLVSSTVLRAVSSIARLGIQDDRFNMSAFYSNPGSISTDFSSFLALCWTIDRNGIIFE
jgi:hypothetical protein